MNRCRKPATVITCPHSVTFIWIMDGELGAALCRPCADIYATLAKQVPPADTLPSPLRMLCSKCVSVPVEAWATVSDGFYVLANGRWEQQPDVGHA